MTARARTTWTFLITAVALFMVTLDNLVVTTALPVIRRDLHADLQQLEWTVNAYTLTFAVLLLTGAALGDRFGRRRIFTLGLAVFSLGSAAAALAPSATWLIAARAVQGAGAAMVTPLTLTLLSAAVRPERRGLALIFWLNVPIGLALAPLARVRLTESRGPDRHLDLAGLALASAGLFAVVWGLVRANSQGWTSPEILSSLAAGVLVLAIFVTYEFRARAPMLPMRFFRNRTFSGANVASMLMFFGMFGSVFLLAQFFQTVQGLSPLGAGMRILPWTAMPLLVAPTAGALSDRISGRTLLALGLALQAAGLFWIAQVTTATTPYSSLVIPFVLSGIGMGLFFAPVANLVLSSVRRENEGKASGANNAIRELGGVLGVAVLASIFAHSGGYTSSHAFVAGVVPAITVGSIVVAVGALAAALIPGRRRVTVSEAAVEVIAA
ncbi:MAG: MFS transporter [Chloroflexi bacterium]|nr:MAG: MFS transporter [Chloroflexota bacterium]